MFINLTPHDVNVFAREDAYKDGKILRLKAGSQPIATFPPSNTIARCRNKTQESTTIDGVTVNKITYSGVHGVPAAMPGVYYIVSKIVAQAMAAQGRHEDLFTPNTLVRDIYGNVVGCLDMSNY